MSKFFRRSNSVEPTEVNRYCRQEANLLVNRHIKDIFADLNNNVELGLHYTTPAPGASGGVPPGIGKTTEAPTIVQQAAQLNAPIPLQCNRKSCPGHPRVDSQTPPIRNTSVRHTRRSRRERVTTSLAPDDGYESLQEDGGDDTSSEENIPSTQRNPSRPSHKTHPVSTTKAPRVSEIGYPPNSETHARGRVPHSASRWRGVFQEPTGLSTPSRWDDEPDHYPPSHPRPMNRETPLHTMDRPLLPEPRSILKSHVGPLSLQSRILQEPNAQQDFPTWSKPKVNNRLRKNKSLPDLPPSSLLFGTPRNPAQALISEEGQHNNLSIRDSTLDGSKTSGPEKFAKPRLRQLASQSSLRSTSDVNEKSSGTDLRRSHKQVIDAIEACQSKTNPKIMVGTELVDSLERLKQLVQMREQDYRLIGFTELNKLNGRLNKLHGRLLKPRKSDKDNERLYEEVLPKVDLWVKKIGTMDRDLEISKISSQGPCASKHGAPLLSNIPLPPATPAPVDIDEPLEYSSFAKSSSLQNEMEFHSPHTPNSNTPKALPSPQPMILALAMLATVSLIRPGCPTADHRPASSL